MTLSKYKYNLVLTVLFSALVVRVLGTPFRALSPAYMAVLTALALIDFVSFISSYAEVEPDFWAYLFGRSDSFFWPRAFRASFAATFLLAAVYGVLQSLFYSGFTVDRFPRVLLMVALLLSGLFAYVSLLRNTLASGDEESSPREGRKRGRRLGFLPMLSLILAAGLGLRLYTQTGSFRQDEFQHLAAALGYLKTGKYVAWNFLKQAGMYPYPRAWPFTWQVAQAFRFFGVSPLSGRLVSLAWGLALILLSYRVAGKLTGDKRIGIALAALVAVSPTLVDLSVYIRMYAMFVVAFLLFVYFCVRALEDNDEPFFPGGIAWPYFGAAVALFVLSVLTHIITLVAVIGIMIYLAAMYLATRRETGGGFNKYGVGFLLLAGMALSALVWGSLQVKDYTGLHFISLVSNYPYLEYAVRPFPMTLGLPFLFLGAVSSVRERKLALLTAVSMSSLAFFVFIGDRYVGSAYIANIMPLLYLMIILGLREARSLMNGRLFDVAAFMTAGLVLVNSLVAVGNMRSQSLRNSPDFDGAYAYLERTASAGSLVWMVYPRDYYLARHPGLVRLGIRDITRDREFNQGTLTSMIAARRRFYVLVDENKLFHVQPELRAFFRDRVESLDDPVAKYGFFLFTNAAATPASRRQ